MDLGFWIADFGLSTAAHVPNPKSAIQNIKSAILLVLWLSCCPGCVKPLFPQDQPRNQFETYDKMRNRAAPLEEPDVFGNPQPALRARLSQPK